VLHKCCCTSVSVTVSQQGATGKYLNSCAKAHNKNVNKYKVNMAATGATTRATKKGKRENRALRVLVLSPPFSFLLSSPHSCTLGVDKTPSQSVYASP